MLSIFFLFQIVFFMVCRVQRGYRIILDTIILGSQVYLLFLNKQSFSEFINILILVTTLVYSFSDIIYGFLYSMLTIPCTSDYTNKFLDAIDNKKYQLKPHLPQIREVFTLLIICFIFFMQNKLNKDFKEYHLIEFIGLDLALFSLYGIYTAFLQFLIENDQNYYLGISKVRFLLDESISSQITRSKIFAIILLATVAIPIVLQSETFYSIDKQQLIHMWQSCVLFLIVTYIYLLKLNFSFIYKIFNWKTQDLIKKNSRADGKNTSIDRYMQVGLDRKIRESIQWHFNNEFWEIAKNPNRYIDNYISIRLKEQIYLISKKEEIEELILIIFDRNLLEDFNLTQNIFNYIKKLNKDETKNFFNFYKKFCINKWNYLERHRTQLSAYTWEKLINLDLEIFDILFDLDDTQEIFNSDYEINKNLRFKKPIRNILFTHLIKHKEINLEELLNDVNAKNTEINNRTKEYEKIFLQDKKNILESELDNTNHVST